MGRFGWTTDLHLNFVPDAARADFYAVLRNADLDALLVGGDVGEAESVETYLRELEENFCFPIYFVLGNHDFHGGSIKDVRRRIHELTNNSNSLRWLNESGVVQLNSTAALIGHDSWADGRIGDFFNSEVILNDFLLIDELRVSSKNELLRALRALGDEAAEYIRKAGEEAASNYRQVIVLTHVPPFKESCWHEGRISDDGLVTSFFVQSFRRCFIKGCRESSGVLNFGFVRTHARRRLLRDSAQSCSQDRAGGIRAPNASSGIRTVRRID